MGRPVNLAKLARSEMRPCRLDEMKDTAMWRKITSWLNKIMKPKSSSEPSSSTFGAGAERQRSDEKTKDEFDMQVTIEKSRRSGW